MTQAASEKPVIETDRRVFYVDTETAVYLCRGVDALGVAWTWMEQHIADLDGTPVIDVFNWRVDGVIAVESEAAA